MGRGTQISAFVSRDTKALLERYARAAGVKKGYLVEMALRHHLQALQELPADVIVAPRLVVSQQSGKEILQRLEAPPQPTKELRDLLSDGD